MTDNEKYMLLDFVAAIVLGFLWGDGAHGFVIGFLSFVVLRVATVVHINSYGRR